MGYQTYYALDSNLESDEEFEKIVNQIRSTNDDATYAFDNSGNTEQPIKWYDHEEDMIEISKQFPEVIFTLYGTGDETYDIWKKYFKNGQMQIAPANITFDECIL